MVFKPHIKDIHFQLYYEKIKGLYRGSEFVSSPLFPDEEFLLNLSILDGEFRTECPLTDSEFF